MKQDKQETMRCRECEDLFLVPRGCDYTVTFSDPDCLNCLIDNEKSRKKKAEKFQAGSSEGGDSLFEEDGEKRKYE